MMDKTAKTFKGKNPDFFFNVFLFIYFFGEEDNTKESVFTLSITSSHKPIVPHPLKSTENITKTIEIKKPKGRQKLFKKYQSKQTWVTRLLQINQATNQNRNQHTPIVDISNQVHVQQLKQKKITQPGDKTVSRGSRKQ